MNAKNLVTKTFDTYIKPLLFPNRCPACMSVLEFGNRGFCASCRREIVPAIEPSCKICGRPLKDDAKEFCRDCGKIRHFFRQNKAFCTYEGAAKQAIYSLKYHNARWIASIFAEEFVRLHLHWLRNCSPEIIIPAPMFAKKRKARGYDQAQVLAAALSKSIWNQAENRLIPVVPLVKRIRNTVPQKELSVSERRKNLKRAFKLDKSVVELEKICSNRGSTLFRSVLVVDDIYTTGTTLDAISELLLSERIAKEVYTMTAVVGQSI